MVEQKKSSAGLTCLKVLLTIFNTVFVMSGAALVVVGVMTRISFVTYLRLATAYYDIIPTVHIAVGVTIMVIGILGCCCTCKSFARMLYVYAVLLIIITLLEVSVAVAAFVYRSQLDNNFNSGLTSAMNAYKMNSTSQQAVDDLQTSMHCCGHDKYDDWFTIGWSADAPPTTSVPASCCVTSGCINTGLPPSSVSQPSLPIYTEGCYVKISAFIHDHSMTLGGVAAGFAFLQLFGAILVCCQAKQIRQLNTYDRLA